MQLFNIYIAVLTCCKWNRCSTRFCSHKWAKNTTNISRWIPFLSLFPPSMVWVLINFLPCIWCSILLITSGQWHSKQVAMGSMCPRVQGEGGTQIAHYCPHDYSYVHVDMGFVKSSCKNMIWNASIWISLIQNIFNSHLIVTIIIIIIIIITTCTPPN